MASGLPKRPASPQSNPSVTMEPMLSPTAVLAVLTMIGCLYLVYRAALPKPIPGIPFYPGSDKNLLGNLPQVFAHLKTAGRFSSFFYTPAEDLRDRAHLDGVGFRRFLF